MKNKIILFALATLAVQTAMAQSNPGSPNGQNAAAPAGNSGSFVQCYNRNYLHVYVAGDFTNSNTFSWDNGGGGEMTDYYNIDDELSTASWPKSFWPEPVPPGTGQDSSWGVIFWDGMVPPLAPEGFPGRYCDAYFNDPFEEENFYKHEQTGLALATGGPQGSTRVNLWTVSASANKETFAPSDEPPDAPVDSTVSSILFKNIGVGVFGQLNAQGNAYKMLQDNLTADMTPYVSGNDHYNFSAGVGECSFQIPTVTPDAGLLVATNPYTYLVAYCPGSYVTVVGTPCCSTDTNALAIYWTMNGGLPYTNQDGTIDPTIRLVDRGQIGSVSITAANGNMTKTIKVIIYQATVEIDAAAGDCLLTQHAWWAIDVQPSDVYPFLKAADGTDLTPNLGINGYYGEDNNIQCECPGCAARVESGPQPITGTTPQQYYTATSSYWWCISFTSLIGELVYVRDLKSGPGTYVIDATGICDENTHDCVSVANDVVNVAGDSTGYSGWDACDFSSWLLVMPPPSCGCN
jgi:hypothetical protein